MLMQRMTSQPDNPPMAWDRSGRHHILYAATDDAGLAQRLMAWPPVGPLHVLCVADPVDAPSVWGARLPAGAVQHVARDDAAALLQLQDLLAQADMGTRFYAVGPEDRVWTALRLAGRCGLGPNALHAQHLGRASRPVFCVHCRHTNHGVHQRITDCGGCGRALLVRDHFSRRLGAYMGVQVDAEVPGERPAPEELDR